MQAIRVTYHGATNYRPSRIKAACAARAKFYPYDHDLGIEDNKRVAAIALATELDWMGSDYGRLVGGTLADGSDVFVFCKPVRRLACACCGEAAGHWEQHYNQDTGHGICADCVAMIRERFVSSEGKRGESDAEIVRIYGLEGINWGKSA